jgi:hypothetical protein
VCRETNHLGPKRRGMRLEVLRPSLAALVPRLFMLIALLAVIPPAVVRAAPDSSTTTGARTIYHKGRNFRIPFNLNAEGRDRVKELHLLYSEDQGYHWRPSSRTLPDHPTFTFRSSHDGEYWFAVQTLTVDGKVSPKLDSTVEPNLKVVVDTFPPTLLLDPDGRRGSLARVRWEVKDENLDLKSLVLEYQVEGVGVWRRVPIRRPKLIDSQQWDAGTAEALKVRATVADKAGNVAEAVIDLPEGTASQGDLVATEPGYDGPPDRLQISDGADPEITAGQGFTPVTPGPAARKPSSASSRPARVTRAIPNANSTRRVQRAASDWDRDAGSPGLARSTPPVVESPPVDLFAAGSGGGPIVGTSQPSGDSAPTMSPAFTQPPPSRDGGGGTLLVANSKFKLQYAIDDAGPNGPATIELWITQDGGRTWIRRGDDQDRVSPIDVDLGGEGTYGLCLVARSASGLGDQPPAPGDPPQSWVEVDSTPPAIQLLTPQVGTGVNSGKVAIAWRASDLHLPPKSVSLLWRNDQPDAQWQIIADAQENAGQFVWTVPATAPQRFHLKVEAIDTVGHRGSADTTEMGPVMVDRSRPRSRIIGLDPAVRSGTGPSARPLR